MYYFNIVFEFDADKSRLNLQKHGISLEEARELWLAPGVELEARSSTEPRWMRISVWRGKYYSCFYTIREGRIRLISARRSRETEKISIMQG